MRTIIVVGWTLALTQGCVSRSRYAALETSYDDAVAARDRAQSEAEACAEDLQQSRRRSQHRAARFSAVYDGLKKVGERGLAEVRVEDGRAVVQLRSDVLFASGSAALTAEGQAAVTEIAQILAKGDARFQVEGHTDSAPIQSREFPTNWHLGADRAINVVLAMVEAGFPADRVSAASYGSTMSAGGDAAADRRIELVWMPDLAEVLPYRRMLEQLERGEGAPGVAE
ncbi:MAG: OmpA family protein [Alphaproteobacteria bacterium]|nr:OmpA family protein [Alphaproteobacteria bacterium]MCB9699242.1 OmpA family protein [Alphaproteobacteria bacterium]